MVKNQLLIHQGKLLSKLIQIANMGNGSTWPGHLALKINRNFIKDILKNSQTKVLFIVGTNGKTTTTSLISHILQADGKKVIQNTSGANLLNGIASTLLLHASSNGTVQADFILFEIDESAFPLACKELTPDAIVMLNLFRDQLDRYGEVNTIALKWQEALNGLPTTTQLFLNADDPQIAFLGKRSRLNELYFGIDEKEKKSPKIDHSSDSTYCPNCGEKLKYSKRYYSHLGIWSCPGCQLTHPTHVLTVSPLYPLDGLYNRYNINAATLVGRFLGVHEDKIKQALTTFTPVFGRQEKMLIEGKNIEIILAKNPAGMDQALQTILEKKAKNILFALNDHIADGTDVSWIWDIDFEQEQLADVMIVASGTRAFDLGLRLKYAQTKSQIEPNLNVAIQKSLKQMPTGERLYILATYTAMLEAREILTGRKIL